MRFAFTDEQLALRDAVRDLLQRECPPAAVRAAWTNETGRVPGLWKKLAEAGVLGLLASEKNGGLGLSEVDLVLILEETGRFAVPEPIVETAAVAVPLLGAIDQSELVALAVAGEVSVTVGFPALSAAGSSSGAWARTCDYFLLPTPYDSLIHVLPRQNVVLTPQSSVDGSRRPCTIEEGGASDGPLKLQAHGRHLAQAAFDRGCLGLSAQLLGIAQHLIDVTVDYVKVREQFKQPVGSFQAVKHHLADAFIKLEFARPLVYRAAWSVAHDDRERSIHVSMAKSAASDAALLAAQKALQCHGAIGYSYEYDLHLWMKRAWALAGAWGDAVWHRARVAEAILDRPTGES
jgi:alkylation response protein AidB-like acyl-CoA dehydrogenase